jgi:UDP-glucuronate 4-epimerase
VTPGVVLVTGGAGFVAWHVARALLESGCRVRAIDSFDPFYARAFKERGIALLRGSARFEFVGGDVREVVALHDAMSGAAAVVHLAARPGVRQSLTDPETYRSINVDGTRAVLAAARERGIRRVVFASSSSVYGAGAALPFREDAPLGEPLSPYAVTKREGERLCREFAEAGLGRVAIVRLFSVYGPRQRPDLALHAFARRIARGEPIPQFGDGSATRDYTHVHDVVDGLLAALAWTEGGDPACEAFNLGTGRPVRLDSLIAKLGSAMGKVPWIERRPGHPADLPATWADTGKAQAVLGYAPRVDLDAGIADFVTWFGETYGRQSSTAA